MFGVPASAYHKAEETITGALRCDAVWPTISPSSSHSALVKNHQLKDSNRTAELLAKDFTPAHPRASW